MLIPEAAREIARVEANVERRYPRAADGVHRRPERESGHVGEPPAKMVGQLPASPRNVVDADLLGHRDRSGQRTEHRLVPRAELELRRRRERLELVGVGIPRGSAARADPRYLQVVQLVSVDVQESRPLRGQQPLMAAP